MKKAIIFVVLAMVLLGACAAQSANDAQRIVGTWVSTDGKTTFVFNTNGTGTVSGYHSDIDGNLLWGITASGELFISYLKDKPDGRGDYSNFAMSPDNKRMSIGYYMYQKK